MSDRGLRLGVMALVVALAGCGEPERATLGQLHQAVGVPQDGFPSWQERVILVLTNRARSDPDAENQAVCGGLCATYPASKPLEYHYDRARAARFQATSLLKAKAGLQHVSVCELVPNLGSIYPSSCDGSPSCACQGGSADCTCTSTSCGSDADCPTGTLCDTSRGKCYYCNCGGVPCTATFSRIALFGTSATGENAAAGNADPIKTFAQWVKSSGHWSNINKSSHGTLGTGHHGASGGCWSNFWVQVFGGGATAETLVGGAHHPRSGSDTTPFSFWANYYDSGAPQLATVNIDGTCHKMTLERGADTNGTFSVEQAIPGSGCHHYYFYFRDASGAVRTYPTTGSFGVGVGTTSCDDYSATVRPPPGTGCGGCNTDAECDDGSPCTTDTCVSNKCQNTVINGCCTSDGQCDDSDPCTTDTCAGNTCQNAAISGCCTSDGQCNDSDPCTADTCAGNTCQNAAISGCCVSASECDDSDPCTQNSCVDNECQFSSISGCCKSDSECDDSSSCTTDSCVDNKCQFSSISGCCTTDADCADNNPCTQETCQLPAGNCDISLVDGCCNTDADCDDSDSCTIDTCVGNSCAHSLAAGCAAPDAGAADDSDAGTGQGSDAGVEPPPQRGVVGASGQLEGGCSLGGTGGSPWGVLVLLLGLALRRR